MDEGLGADMPNSNGYDLNGQSAKDGIESRLGGARYADELAPRRALHYDQLPKSANSQPPSEPSSVDWRGQINPIRGEQTSY